MEWSNEQVYGESPEWTSTSDYLSGWVVYLRAGETGELTDIFGFFLDFFPPYTCYTIYNITIWFNYASVRNKCWEKSKIFILYM